MTTDSGEAGVGVRALERGLDILSCFDIAHPAWTAAELSRESGLHKATTRRLVKTLEAKGFLALDESTGEYRLGPMLLPLSYIARSHDELARLSHPFVEDLATETQGSVGLWVWAGASMVLIDRELTPHAFKPDMRPGDVSTQYGTAFSKILLALGTPDRLTRLRQRNPGLTTADLESIEAELDDVRRTEMAFDVEAGAPGICATAAPVRDSTGDVIASISVVLPPERFGPAQREDIAVLTKQAGEALSRALGYDGGWQEQP